MRALFKMQNCYIAVTLLLHCCYVAVTLLLHCCYITVTDALFKIPHAPPPKLDAEGDWSFELEEWLDCCL
jgi:hypothetical protein